MDNYKLDVPPLYNDSDKDLWLQYHIQFIFTFISSSNLTTSGFHFFNIDDEATYGHHAPSVQTYAWNCTN